MDDTTPIPVTTVSQIAMVPYMDVLKMVESLAEAIAPESPWIEYLGDTRGAVTPIAAATLITTVQLERTSDMADGTDPAGVSDER